MKIMIINCYLSHSCSSGDELKKNIALALKNEGVEANVTYHTIGYSQALSLGISGSPAVFINGKELQPLDAAGYS